jgi:hypothetical protein
VYSSLQVLLALESLITSSTGTPLDLLEHTTPNSNKLPPVPSIARAPSSSSKSNAAKVVPAGLESLAPRKLEAYHLFQIEKLPLLEVTNRMSETNAIKQTSVLWNLLGIYSTLDKLEAQVEWDEKRLVEAVDSLGGLFAGKMKDEHGRLVKELREKVKNA